MNDDYENFDVFESNGWVFWISESFKSKEKGYLGFLSKEKKWIEGYEKAKKKFSQNPTGINDAHQLKYKLKDFWSARCNISRKGDRLIFIKVSRNIVYPLTIIPDHSYKLLSERGVEEFPEALVELLQSKAKLLSENDSNIT